MVRFSCVSKKGSEKFPVVLQNVQFRMDNSSQPFAKIRRPENQLSHFGFVRFLNVVVVRRDDGFLARKIVVSRAGGHFGRSRDIPYCRCFEALFPEHFERLLQNQRLGLLSDGLLGGTHKRDPMLNMFKPYVKNQTLSSPF